MNLYARYVGWLYFKYFAILFIALTLFYVGIDILTNLKDMPASANLKLLYFGLTSLTAVNYVLPLALIFALITSKFSMIRSNELVSFYALGIDKDRACYHVYLRRIKFYAVCLLLRIRQKHR